MASVLLQETGRMKSDTHRGGGGGCDWGQRVEQYKRKSGTISSYKKMEETGRDSPPEPLEGAWPCQDLDFGSVKIILPPWLPEV